MPYIITTHRHLDDPTAEFLPGALPGVSSLAAATLEDARQIAYHAVYSATPAEQSFDGYLAATQTLPAAGGTIGPLPNGTEIVVQEVQWARLLPDDRAHAWPMTDAKCAEVVDAWNGAQAVA